MGSVNYHGLRWVWRGSFDRSLIKNYCGQVERNHISSFLEAYITVDSDKASILATRMAKFYHADWCQTHFAFLREQKHPQALFSKLLANRFSMTNVKTV